jgi:hypothetical protein
VGLDVPETSTSSGGAVILHRTAHGWKSVTGLNLGATASLDDVVAPSASNVWAVGGVRGVGGQGLVMHWNGKTWARIQVPLKLPSDYWQNWQKVIFLSTNDIWLSGWAGTENDEGGGNADEQVVAHFTGKSWRMFTSYAGTLPGGQDGLPGDMYALGPHQVFTVGVQDIYGLGGQYFLEWNGSKWRRLSTRRMPDVSAASGLGGTADSGLWLGTTGVASRPGIARWNGQRWTDMKTAPIPNVDGSVEVISLDVLSDSNVWAVGDANRKPDDADIGIAEHWNGQIWQRVPSAEVPGSLWSVDSADGHVWAVGGGCGALVVTGPAA